MGSVRTRAPKPLVMVSFASEVGPGELVVEVEAEAEMVVVVLLIGAIFNRMCD